MAAPVVINVSINAANAQAGAVVVNSALVSIGTTSQQVARQSAAAFSSVFSGTFLGGLARQAVSGFLEEIKGLAVSSLEAAAKTQALHNAVLSEAQANRIASAEVEKQADAIHRLTFTYEDAYKSLTKMIASQLDFTKASQLAKVAQDLSITTGRGLSDEYEALLRSILQLQSRSLRLAGVYLTVDEVLNKLSATTGRNRNSFTTLEKQQALLNAVIEYGARVSGNFEAVLGTTAGQMKVFEKNVNDAEIALGQAFLPVAVSTLKVLNALLVAVAEHPHIFLTLAAGVGILTASIIAARIAMTDWTGIFAAGSKTIQLSILGMTELFVGLTAAEEQQAIALTGVATATEAVTIAETTAIATTLALGGVIVASTLIVFAGIAALYVWATATNVAKGADEALTLQLAIKNKAMQENIQWLKENTDAVDINSEKHDEYVSILTILNPLERQSVEIRSELSHTTNEAADAMQRLLAADESKFTAQLNAMKAALEQNMPLVTEYNQRILELVNARERARQAGQDSFNIPGPVNIVPIAGSGGEFRYENTEITIKTASDLDAQIQQLNETYKDNNTIVASNIGTLAQLVERQKELDITNATLTGDQTKVKEATELTLQKRLEEIKVGESSILTINGVTEALLKEIHVRELAAGKITTTQEALGAIQAEQKRREDEAFKFESADTLSALTADYNKAFKALELRKKGYAQGQKEGLFSGLDIDNTVIAESSKSLNELYERTRKYFQAFGGQTAFDEYLKKQPEEIRQALEKAEAYKRATYAVRDAQDAAKEHAEAVHRLDIALEKLRVTQSALAGTTKDDTAARRVEQFKLDQYVKLQEDIFKIRAELGKPLTAIGGKGISVEDLQRQLEILNLEKKTKDDIFKLTLVQFEAQQKADIAREASVADVAKAETLYQEQYFNYVRQRKEVEQELTATIATEIQKRAQFERNVQQIEAQAYADILGEQRSARESVISSLTKLNVHSGNFSVEDANSLIQKAKELTTNPLIESQKDLKTATVKAKEATDANVTTLNNHASKIDANISSLDANTLALGTMTDQLKNSQQSEFAPGLSSVPIIGSVLNQFKKGAFSAPQIAGLLSKAGFKPNEIPLFTAITQAESSGIPTNSNLKGADESYGLLQINMKGGLGPSRRAKYGLKSNEDLYDPLTNLRIAHDLYVNGGGLRNWGAYTHGSYRKFYNPSVLGVPISQSNVVTPSAGGGTNRYKSWSAMVQGLSDAGFGEARIASLLSGFGINPSKSNVDLYTSGGPESRALASVAGNLDQLKEGNKQRTEEQRLRQLKIKDLDTEHERELRLNRVDDLYNQSQRVRIDNVIQLQNAEEDLNRLYTDGVSIREQVQSAQLRIIQAETETRKTSIDLAVNEANMARLVKNAIQDEYNTRQKADQENFIKRSVLDKTYTDEYLKSELYRTRVTNDNALARKQAHIDLTTSIIKGEDDLAHFSDDAALRYKIAWIDALKSVKQAHEDAVVAELKADAVISQQGVFDAQKVRASVLDDISKIHAVNDSVAGFFKDTFKVYGDSIDVWIDKTTEKMGNLGKVFNGFFKDVFHRAEGSIEKTLLDAIFPASADVTGAQNLTSSVNNQVQSLNYLSAATQYTAGTMVASANVMANAVSGIGAGVGVLGNFAGVSTPGVGGLTIGGGSGGGISGMIARGISGIFNTGGAGNLPTLSGSGSSIGFPGLTPAQIASLGAAPLPRLSQGGGVAGTTQAGILQAILGGKGLSGLGGIAKSIGGSLGAQAPFLGLSLGAALGGDSKTGSILGALGGGALGLGVLGTLINFGVLGGGTAISTLGASVPGLGALFGLGGLATLGVFGAIAAPLIVGAVILAKNAARRRDETKRADIINTALAQLQTILSNVKADKMDGSEAIQQAQQIRSEYITQVTALKDTKTRNIALKDVSRLDTLISQIQAAAGAQDRRKETDLGIVPTYASGGVTTSDIIRISRGETLISPSGVVKNVPGRFDAKDDILALAPRGTMVVSPQMFRGYASGGITGSAPSGFNPVMHVTVINVMSEEEAKQLANKIPNSVIGKKAAADARVNPSVLPAAVAGQIGVDY